jgi:hypothetical protein
MTITNLTLLGLTVHGTPSGNYDGSSTSFDGDGVKSVGYYRGQGSLETVRFEVTGFEGVITLQATLDQHWPAADWFDVYTYDSSGAPSSDTFYTNITGNFVWVRVHVTDFVAGTINSITLAY